MKYLGIDFGLRKIGLAISEGYLSDPFGVIYRHSNEEAVSSIVDIINTQKIEKVIVGLSEGDIGEKTREFGKLLKKSLEKVDVEYFDETLTTQEAQKLAIKLGIKRKRRKKMEDAFAAALLLQDYIDYSK